MEVLFILLLFIMGIVIDVFYTLLVAAIADGRAVLSALCQFIFTVLVIGATWEVVRSESVPELLAYAVGGAVGTWLVVRFNNGHSAGV